MAKATVKKVTWLPDWLLTIKGKLDGRKGDADIIDLYVGKLWEKSLAFEKPIVRSYELATKEFRIKGAEALSLLNAGTSAASPSEQIESTRAGRRHSSTKKQLIDLNQEILDQNSCLQKKLQKQNSMTLAKIKAYIFGVKKKMPNYCLCELYSSSYNDYVERHSLLDVGIADYANQFV